MAKEQTALHARQYVRFSVPQRIEHALLILSFATLAYTGLIQKFAGNRIAETLIALTGGIELVRTFHHLAAILLALQSVYHVIVLAHKVFVQRVGLTMLPGLRDVTDAIDVLRYNLGLSKEHPKLPRYNFAEKAEYWAMIWGTIIMGLTGFMLWNPILTARLLPGEVIPAAKAAHGGEALLAVLAIFVWHFYNVHIKTFNKAMFTGKMTHHQMVEEHGEELEEILSGATRPRSRPEAIRRRERIFLPIAIVLGVIGVIGVYLFATYETTAVAALPPPATQVPVFAPLTPTPQKTPTGVVDNRSLGTAMKHPVEGMERCDTCHGFQGMSPMPANHVGRPVESCLICHKPGPVMAAGTKPAAGATPAAGQPAVARPLPASHDLTNAMYKDCTLCHGPGKIKPNPADHASFTLESCTTCHKPAATGPVSTPAAAATAQPAAAPQAIPHSITKEIYRDCKVCHAPNVELGIRAPANHASFTNESCTTCHKPTVP